MIEPITLFCYIMYGILFSEATSRALLFKLGTVVPAWLRITLCLLWPLILTVTLIASLFTDQEDDSK